MFIYVDVNCMKSIKIHLIAQIRNKFIPVSLLRIYFAQCIFWGGGIILIKNTI